MSGEAMTADPLTPATAPIAIRRALLSAWDKTGVVDFARALAACGVEILSTGGTAALLRREGVTLRDVSEVTGFPEILDGRVKTLHPAIHAGILARRAHGGDRAVLATHAIGEIDLVCVALYPFAETLARGADDDELVEMIDVGGPAMLRAAAKNHADVVVVSDRAQYAGILADLAAHGGVRRETARRLAVEAFARTAAYDATVARGLAERLLPAGEAWPPPVVAALGVEPRTLRYGENPHQRGALYLDPVRGGDGWGAARVLSGKELSYTNILDVELATRAVASFTRPAAVIVKHATPCGVAEDESPSRAYARALAGDPVSAYGCVAAVNRPVDEELAAAINDTPFLEVLAAPAFTPEGFARLKNTKTRRFVELPAAMFDATAWSEPWVRPVRGGVLVQDPELHTLDAASLRVVTARAPSEGEQAALVFAWQVVRHARSNAIVLARDGATVGIGAGTTSRVEAVHAALRTAGDRAAGAVIASDAFFPMADGLEAAARAGVTAAIQPGGSIRDEEVIAAANAAGMAMVLTGVRCFVH